MRLITNRKKSIGDRIANGVFVLFASITAFVFLGGMISILYLSRNESAKFKSGDLSGMSRQEILNYEMLHALSIQRALANFQQATGSFPSSLNQLVPKFLESIPLDPATNKPYRYLLTTNGDDYSLCPQYAETSNSCGDKNATFDGKAFASYQE